MGTDALVYHTCGGRVSHLLVHVVCLQAQVLVARPNHAQNVVFDSVGAVLLDEITACLYVALRILGVAPLVFYPLLFFFFLFAA